MVLNWALCLILLLTAPIVRTAPSSGELQAKITAITEEMKEQLKYAQDQEHQLLKIEKKLNTEEEQLRVLKNQLSQGQEHLQLLLSQSAQLLTHYTEQIKAFGLQLLLQQHTVYSPLKLFISMEDPRKLSRQLTYYRYLNTARQQYCGNLADTLSALETQQHDIVQQQVLLTQLDHQAEQTLSNLVNEKERRKELLKTLKTSLEKKEPFGQLQKKLPKPIQAPLLILKDRPNTFRGIVLAAKEGTEITAVHKGKIVFADWIRGFGLLAILDHGQGYMTLYGHLQTVYKQLGDVVESGELLARVGQSGGQDQPGLYFEIRKDGEPLDPLVWLKP